MRRVAQLISVRSRCRGRRRKETHTAQLGSHTRGDRETARSAGSRRSRQRERRSRSQGNTERFAITRHSTEKAEVKRALLGEASDCCHVFAGQRTVLNQKRGGVPASHERQVATRLTDPSALQR